MPDTAWVALSLAGHIGSKTLRALLHHFGGDLNAILAADEESLQAVPGVGPVIAQAIRRIDLVRIEREMPCWRADGVSIITFQDGPAYPLRLRALPDAPPTLFVRGEWRLEHGGAVAIVGTRQPSSQSIEATQQLSFELAERGYTIVSGLALGIDKNAHLGALAAPDGYTLAVLGSGVLNVYPPENVSLARAIVGRGALLSEVHPHASPNSASLVARNRIISGLSDAVIVVETEVDGGAMHAARFGQAQGRPVYALDNGASGNRALLDAGAKPIHPGLRGWEDMLGEIGID